MKSAFPCLSAHAPSDIPGLVHGQAIVIVVIALALGFGGSLHLKRSEPYRRAGFDSIGRSYFL